MSLGTRLVVWLISALFSAVMALHGLARYATFHNRTYDLALYARQAWGLAHGQLWDPIVNVHFLGTHIAIVLWPLGLLGRELGTVQVLLVAQALAFGLATLPLAEIGARRFGDAGALCTSLAWLLYPNLSHVASYEFHPGSIGMLPLALALLALDRQRAVSFVVSCVALLACRADFALLTALLGAVALFRVPETQLRRLPIAAASSVLMLSLGYLMLQFLWLRPNYWAHQTSLDLHFARWGGSPTGIVRALFSDPQLVLAHFSEPRRLLYLPSVLLPLGFLPLFAPRWLVFTLPYVAINLISTFPTTLELYSHYLTPAVPTLVVAAVDGLSQLCRRVRSTRLPAIGLAWMSLAALLSNLRSGALPWSHEFDAAAFQADDYTRQASRVIAAIPAAASVQAPDPLLSHLAERPRLYRAPPPERGVDYVVLDVSQRGRYAQQEVLLRTLEEPLARNWLSRRDYGLRLADSKLLLFARRADPRAGPASRYVPNLAPSHTGITLTRCLSVVSARLGHDGLELELTAHAPCPADLALRIGTEIAPTRVDLLFDGRLSPAQLRDEDVLSWHALSAAERARIERDGLRIGALRASGAPPEAGDPISVAIPLIQ